MAEQTKPPSDTTYNEDLIEDGSKLDKLVRDLRNADSDEEALMIIGEAPNDWGAGEWLAEFLFYLHSWDEGAYVFRDTNNNIFGKTLEEVERLIGSHKADVMDLREEITLQNAGYEGEEVDIQEEEDWKPKMRVLEALQRRVPDTHFKHLHENSMTGDNLKSFLEYEIDVSRMQLTELDNFCEYSESLRDAYSYVFGCPLFSGNDDSDGDIEDIESKITMTNRGKKDRNLKAVKDKLVSGLLLLMPLLMHACM